MDPKLTRRATVRTRRVLSTPTRTRLLVQPTMNISDPETRSSKFDPLRQLFHAVIDSLPRRIRGHVVAVLGELVGTTIFLFLAFAAAEVAIVSASNNEGDKVNFKLKSIPTTTLLYIAFGAGFSLAVTAWTFFRISGGLFNPAVSLNPLAFIQKLLMT